MPRRRAGQRPSCSWTPDPAARRAALDRLPLMILSDRDIRSALASGHIGIEPFDEADVQPSSVDLHVDRLFRTFHNHRYAVIDVKQEMEDLTELVEVTESEPFMLHPGEFVLGSTAEYVKLPHDLVARLEGKSSLGRLGLLIHSSLPAEEEVVFLHQGSLERRRIDEIVGKRLEGCVVAFDPETFEVGYHDITGWWEGAPDRIFEVVLASGRRVKLTGGHDLFTLTSSGDVVKVPIHSVAPGAKIALPRRIPDPATPDPVVFNLLQLAPESRLQQLVCSGPSVDAAWTRNDSIPGALRACGITHVAYYRKRSVLPLHAAHLAGVALTARDFLAVRGGRHRIPAVIEVDREIAWLFGLYVAEGHVRDKQVTVSNTDPFILDRAEAAFASIGLPVYRASGAITCCSSLMAHLMNWLGIGGRAREKRIPRMALGWPTEILASFLEGFIDGDGSRESTRISLWSSSPRLIEDLLLVCERLGYRASASVRERSAGPSWQVSIPRREHKLLTAVPSVPDLLIESRKLCQLDQKTAAALAGFKHATQLNNLERGLTPGVRVRTLERIRGAYRHSGAGSPKLDRLVDGDLCWDEVVEVRDTGRVEPVYDLEVRPGGRKVENFLVGSGVFVSNTAGYVDPGFEGHLTLELSNVANLPITLYPGMKIGQISFFRLTSPAENPYGSSAVGSKYQGQRGPTPSRYFDNFK